MARLPEILNDGNWPDEDDDVYRWLTWCHNFLSARKMHHKKAAVRTAILKKMATTLLSKDELDAIDAEAERQLGSLEDEPATMAMSENDPAWAGNRKEDE